MQQLHFKNFGDFGFIQSIDKPKIMGSLLSDYSDYFAKRGIDVSQLTNDDRCDRKLLAAFTQANEDMPPKLLETLYELDDLSDEPGLDRILDEADRLGIRINGEYADLNPGELAITVRGKYAQLIRRCHQKTIARKAKAYHEFQSREGKQLSLTKAEELQTSLENSLAPWFEAKNRSRACEIYIYQEKGEIRFQITHGRPYRTDGCIDKQLKRSLIAYRPQKHDYVIYNNHCGMLRISAQTVAEKELYRQTFGEVLFGDSGYFPEGEIYSLEPLRRGRSGLKLVPGIESVRLTEVHITIDDNQQLMQHSKGHDLFENIERFNRPNLNEGHIIRAKFMIRYSSGGRQRKLELRTPNVADYDRDRDGIPAERFMETNGFITVNSDA